MYAHHQDPSPRRLRSAACSERAGYGLWQLSTNAQGLVQVLLGGDASDAEIQINGAKVWSGPQTTLKPMEVFKLKGDAYQRQ